ncbi:hypothetical protein PBY51_011453 [Eleginops maclovinus]|uniref:Uncharacterized protein n=1 Tax=Eleginops maclovinus TaxID=56733 RepID=A0AAN7XVV6_ELEMC|nr:hypothetical protein PBY51_011453 [Eleginops maclovinus]
MWVKALTAEESPSSLQQPPLGLLKKPFMFLFDLKGKYTPDAFTCCAGCCCAQEPLFRRRGGCLLQAGGRFNRKDCAAA